MTIEVRVPVLGESVTEATVATWFKKPGDAVVTDEMLCELETDKVTVEVPAPAAGVLGDILAREGETVGVGALLATLETGAGAGAAPSAASAPQRPAQAASPSASGSIDVMVPTLGESVTEATVSTWFKAAGDSVQQDETLCELETDKVSIEVPSPATGVLREILAAEGTTVQAAGKLAVLATGTNAVAQAPAAPAAAPAVARKTDTADAPSARKLMAEKGIDPAAVKGSGRDGRVMKEDIIAALSKPVERPVAPPAPRIPVPVEDAAREERIKMTRLRQTIARRLKDAQNTAAILTTYNEVDMTEVMALRAQYKDEFEKRHGVRLGFMAFFTKACCAALKDIPEVNAEIDGDEIVYKNFVHMGIATGTPQGLVVPVIRDADSMSFAQIEAAIAEKGKRARDGKLSMAELQGGTFTISNGGVYGSLMSSPILNPPQSGILGMHKIQERPMVVKGQIVARPMMYLALSYDHRIVDGKGAVTFLVKVKDALEDPRRLLMDL